MSWEYGYLELLDYVRHLGTPAESRAGNTMAALGMSLSIDDLEPGQFPLLTTRKMFYKPVLGELAAFLRGATDNGTFMDMGCNYWTMNARQWERNKHISDDKKLQLGAIYGRQWRAFDGGHGKLPIDQLIQARTMIMQDPISRRIIVTAWNPHDVAESCLPPCHVMFQYSVLGKRLHCSVYMRSVDLCLGLPSDIVLYYTLLILMAHDTGLETGELHFHFGNAHIYEGHIRNMDEQIRRAPGVAPKYTLSSVGQLSHSMYSFLPDDLIITDYKPLEAIAYELY